MNGHHGMMWLRGLSRRRAVLAATPYTFHVRYATTRSSTPATNVGSIKNTPHLKRKLGQHLLVNDKILSQIVDAAELPALIARKQAALDASGDGADDGQQAIVRVLEIGPGTGNLTSALLAVAPNIHVHSVEFDNRMVERLNTRFADELASQRLVIENIDFEQFAFEKQVDEPAEATKKRVSIRGRAKARERATAAAVAAEQNALRRFDACVANIPYQLSSIIISRLTNDMFRFPGRMQSAVLLVQEEFAQRLIAKPGTQNYSRLSVNTALIADVQSVVPVGRNHFLPPPKVDSRVIKIVPKPRQSADEDSDTTTVRLPDTADEQRFFQRFDTLLRIAFTRKNKTLRAALVSGPARALMEKETQTSLSKEDINARVAEALEATGLTTKRAVQLPVHDFKSLMDALSARGITFQPSNTRHFKE